MAATKDPFNLHRFVLAQESVYDDVLSELRAGKKRGHWMWYIFPQIAGLGNSALSIEYAISSLDEAQKYLQHTTLGTRLRECTRIVLSARHRTIRKIFDGPDDLKFRSCMTLFSQASANDRLFLDALEKYFDGKLDDRTLHELGIV